MDKENTGELFSVKINDKGASLLLKFTEVIKIYLIAGCIWSGISFADSLIYVITKNTVYEDPFFNFYFSIYPFISLITVCIFIFQLFLYNKLRVSIKKAIHSSDEHKLNIALDYLSKSMWIAIILNGFSILVGILSLVVSIKVRL